MVGLHNIDNDTYSPYDDGWNERINHKHLDDNPFGINNWKYIEWEKGWLAADKTIQEEEQKSK